MNTLKKFFALLVFTAFLAGCNKPTGSTTEPPQPPKDTTERVMNIAKPKETITLERAHAMYQAYQERFNALTKFRKGQEDARYGWHSIEFYKNYIAYLEAEAKKVKIPISGLRLYYVAYPNDESAKEYKDYQTYIYVPTYFDKETKKHIAFDPLHIDANGKPVPIHSIIVNGPKPAGANKMSLLKSEQSASSVANMGEMCKPNCSE